MFSSTARLLVELAILLGILSVTVGLVQKLVQLTTVYLPRILGLTPTDFLLFGVVCFVLAQALTARQVLKYLEGKAAGRA